MNFFGKFNYPPATKADEGKKEESISSVYNLDEESFKVFLDKVKNQEFTEKELKEMGFSSSDFKKEWIKSGEVSDFDKKSAEEFNKSISEEAEARGTLLSTMRKAWDSKFLKVAFVCVILMGKFGGKAHGSEHAGKDAKQNNIESSINLKSNNDGNDGNYDASDHFAKVKKGGNDNTNMAGLKFKEAPIADFSVDEAKKINNDYEHFMKTLKFDNNGKIIEDPIKNKAVDDNKKIEDLKASLHSDFETITSSELKAVSVLDVTNSFKIDNASITGNDLIKITHEIDNMFSKITPDNVDSFIKTDKVVSADSSPEATKYKAADKNAAPTLENNKQLSEDRADALIKIYKDVAKNHDFSKSGLTTEQVKQIIDGEVKKVISERGYKLISELGEINPKTGEKYTDKEAEELKKTNYEEYMKLSDKCREVKANFMLDNKVITEKVIEKIPPMEAQKKLMEMGRTHEMQIKIIDRILHSDHTIILADDSNSMKGLMEQFSDNLTKIVKDNGADSKCDIKLYSFSENIGEKIQVNNLSEAGQKIAHMPTVGGSFEKSAHSALEAIKDSKIGDEKGVKTILIATNEAIKASKADMDLLAKEAAEKGINIYYVLGNVNHVEGLNVAVVPIEAVKAEFDKIYGDIVSDAAKLIKLNESNLSNKHLIESGYFKHGVVEKMQKETLAKKSEVVNLSEATLRLSSFDIKDDKGNIQDIAMRDYM